MLVLKSRAGVSAPASGDEQVTRRSGCSALLSERDGHRWPVVACWIVRRAAASPRVPLGRRCSSDELPAWVDAGAGLRAVVPVRFVGCTLGRRSYVCTPCAPRTAWRCCRSSLSQRSPRRVREAVTTGIGDDQVETRVLERPCLHVSLGQSIQ